MSGELPDDAGETARRLIEADNAGELIPPVRLGPFSAFVLAGGLRIGLTHPVSRAALTEQMEAHLVALMHATVEQLPPAAQALLHGPDEQAAEMVDAVMIAGLYQAEVDGATLPRKLHIGGPFAAFLVITTLQLARAHPGIAEAPLCAAQMQTIIDVLTGGMPPYARSLAMAGNQ